MAIQVLNGDTLSAREIGNLLATWAIMRTDPDTGDAIWEYEGVEVARGNRREQYLKVRGRVPISPCSQLDRDRELWGGDAELVIDLQEVPGAGVGAVTRG